MSRGLSVLGQQQLDAARQAAREQKLDLAILHLQMALNTDPEVAEVHFLLVDCLLALAQADDALGHLNAHKDLLANQARFYLQQGQALSQLQQDAEAGLVYQQAFERFPDETSLQLALAQRCQDQGDLPQALYYYRMAARLRPDDMDTQLTLADILRQTGALDEARQLYLKVYTRSPERSDALLYWLQSQDLTRSGEIVAALIALAQRAPQLKNYLALQAFSVLYTVGEADEARQSLNLALQEPELENKPAYALIQQLIAPFVPASAAELLSYQDHLMQHLQAAEPPETPLIYSDYSNLMPYLRLWEPLSYLPFFNIDPHPLRVLLARFFQACLPKLPPLERRPTPAEDRLPKVGLLFSQSEAAETFWLETLLHWPEGLHELNLLYLPPASPPASLSSYRSDFRFCVLPESPADQLQWLQQGDFDLLFFTELMTEQLDQTFLAAHRLAPVQLTSWLSSGTSGLPSVDYFISSQQLEQQEAPERFYSEKLIRLQHLPGCLPLQMSVLSAPARSEYGLPEQGRIYLCPHHLFKLHPDFDAALALILAGDPDGHLVLQSRPDIDGQTFYRQWLSRFEGLYPDLLSRIWCLPLMSESDFMGLLQTADVLLDPFYVGGGRVTLAAFSLGLPVITWPSERAAGRLAYALYQAMELLDCVAYNPQDYVEKALAVARNPAYRTRLSAAMLAGHGHVFEQQAAAEELATCLSGLIHSHNALAIGVNIDAPGGSELPSV
ncbi:MAG: tetratricopeptide repeat protein [Candidatus Sericytochromatia bacterium]|nr:tetratricopeptide repeat protein [Candidatus Sericytochromatia bacterium]